MTAYTVRPDTARLAVDWRDRDKLKNGARQEQQHHQRAAAPRQVPEPERDDTVPVLLPEHRLPDGSVLRASLHRDGFHGRRRVRAMMFPPARESWPEPYGARILNLPLDSTYGADIAGYLVTVLLKALALGREETGR